PRGTASRQRVVAFARGLAAAHAVHTGTNRLRPLRLGKPVAVLSARRLRHGFLLSTPELAVLAGLPTDLAVPGLARARAKAAPARGRGPPGGRGTLGLGRAQVGDHPVSLNVADARQHLHVMGSTGSGKSTLLLNLVLGHVHAGRGAVVIDPKGDLVTDVLDR